jgi:ribosomal protein L40E
MLICVFCETTYPEDAVICRECQDYKGMMKLEHAKQEYDFIRESFEEDADE